MPEESSSVQETKNGLKKEGDLEEIAEFAEDVGEAMEDSEVSEESTKKFDEWRPRKEESKEEIKRKTVEAATGPEKDLEKKGNGIKEDLGNASNEIAGAGERIGKGEVPDKEVKEASRYTFYSLLSSTAKFMRKIEEGIYSKLMIRFNDLYFDSKDISADIKDHGDQENFTMDVKVPEKEKREQIKDGLNGNKE